MIGGGELYTGTAGHDAAEVVTEGGDAATRGPEEAPDLAHHQEWTMGMQRPKLEEGLVAAAQAAGKRDQEK